MRKIYYLFRSFAFFSKASASKKVKTSRVLDEKDYKKLSILLGGPLRNLKYEDVRKYILRCDVSKFPGDSLEQLTLALPPPDQLKQLEKLKNEYDDLNEAEQFAVTVSPVSFLNC